MEGDMRVLPIALGLAWLAGAAAHAQSVNDDPTGPQPPLPTEALTIVNDQGQKFVFSVEVAATEQEQTTGLMWRKSVADDGGMLFPLPAPQVAQFWMKNTVVPLDMVFIGADGTIKAISENTVPYSLGIESSGVPVMAVLELEGGITAKDQISVGDKVVAKQFGQG
jgi:uncharacterized membrane protein (UPF0127 family)